MKLFSSNDRENKTQNSLMNMATQMPENSRHVMTGDRESKSTESSHNKNRI